MFQTEGTGEELFEGRWDLFAFLCAEVVVRDIQMAQMCGATT